jgi:hypothetical protein
MRIRFFTDYLTAMALLAGSFPGQRTTRWTCKKCGLWLGALDLGNGLVAQGVFGEEVVYTEDPELGRWPLAVGVVLKTKLIKDRHQICCERCGTVNRRYRRG